MLKRRVGLLGVVVAMVGMAATGVGGAQAKPAPAAAADVAKASTPEEAGRTQEELLKRLRMSPTLSAVVAGDPTLLSNLEYVGRNNPELAQFLQQHPEVTRNPAFYLFSDLHQPGQRQYEVMEPREGFVPRERYVRSQMEVFMNDAGPVFAMLVCGGIFVWVIRTVLENRRWSRTFKLHSEVHGKLIDKFGSNQELLGYMETDAGRRFLEAAPIATEANVQRVPNVVSRVLTTLQAGLVMVLLGAGLLFVRHSVPEGETAMLIFGIVILMPGIGFTISAAVTWVLAGRLGLMPQSADTAGTTERL